MICALTQWGLCQPGGTVGFAFYLDGNQLLEAIKAPGCIPMRPISIFWIYVQAKDNPLWDYHKLL